MGQVTLISLLVLTLALHVLSQRNIQTQQGNRPISNTNQNRPSNTGTGTGTSNQQMQAQQQQPSQWFQSGGASQQRSPQAQTGIQGQAQGRNPPNQNYDYGANEYPNYGDDYGYEDGYGYDYNYPSQGAGQGQQGSQQPQPQPQQVLPQSNQNQNSRPPQQNLNNQPQQGGQVPARGVQQPQPTTMTPLVFHRLTTRPVAVGSGSQTGGQNVQNPQYGQEEVNQGAGNSNQFDPYDAAYDQYEEGYDQYPTNEDYTGTNQNQNQPQPQPQPRPQPTAAPPLPQAQTTTAERQTLPSIAPTPAPVPTQAPTMVPTRPTQAPTLPPPTQAPVTQPPPPPLKTSASPSSRQASVPPNIGGQGGTGVEVPAQPQPPTSGGTGAPSYEDQGYEDGYYEGYDNYDNQGGQQQYGDNGGQYDDGQQGDDYYDYQYAQYGEYYNPEDPNGGQISPEGPGSDQIGNEQNSGQGGLQEPVDPSNNVEDSASKSTQAKVPSTQPPKIPPTPQSQPAQTSFNLPIGKVEAIEQATQPSTKAPRTYDFFGHGGAAALLTHPGIIVGLVGLALILLLFAILLAMYIIYKIKNRSDRECGIYSLDESKDAGFLPAGIGAGGHAGLGGNPLSMRYPLLGAPPELSGAGGPMMSGLAPGYPMQPYPPGTLPPVTLKSGSNQYAPLSAGLISQNGLGAGAMQPLLGNAKSANVYGNSPTNDFREYFA